MSEITDKWRKLRHEMGNLICAVDGKIEKIDAEEKRMEQKRDASYIEGAEDMKKALCILHDSEQIFNTAYEYNLLKCVSAANIIKKAEELKEEQEKLKEATFAVGDEIECIDPLNMQYGKKCVVLRVREEMKLLDLSDFTVYYSNNFSDYRKTGKKYSPDPIPFEKTCTEGENK